jgi:hypothetical protein
MAGQTVVLVNATAVVLFPDTLNCFWFATFRTIAFGLVVIQKHAAGFNLIAINYGHVFLLERLKYFGDTPTPKGIDIPSGLVKFFGNPKRQIQTNMGLQAEFEMQIALRLVHPEDEKPVTIKNGRDYAR